MAEEFGFGVEIAERLANAADDEWPFVIEELRRSKNLSRAMRAINEMLENPAHRQLANNALRRIGLDDATIIH